MFFGDGIEICVETRDGDGVSKFVRSPAASPCTFVLKNWSPSFYISVQEKRFHSDAVAESLLDMCKGLA